MTRSRVLPAGDVATAQPPLAAHRVDLAALPGEPCPCGIARRGLVDYPQFPGTVHRTEISCDALVHYHQRLSETYYVLECDSDAQIELDGVLTPVAAGACIHIPPGVRHRAVGRMTVYIVCFPKFDPTDEWFD